MFIFLGKEVVILAVVVVIAQEANLGVYGGKCPPNAKIPMLCASHHKLDH